MPSVGSVWHCSAPNYGGLPHKQISGQTDNWTDDKLRYGQTDGDMDRLADKQGDWQLADGRRDTD